MNHDDLPYRPCAGVVLKNADGHVFAGLRLDHQAGAWQMPQGGIDDGEAPRDAALRELEEETGIHRDLVTIKDETTEWILYDLPDELLGKIWGGKFRGQRQKWFLLEFHGHDEDVNIETDHPEFSAWNWLTPREVLEGIVPFKREVYRRVFEAFGMDAGAGSRR